MCLEFLGIFDVCLVVSPTVPDVTVPFSNVNVVCEKVFCESNCALVVSQTFALSPENVTRV